MHRYILQQTRKLGYAIVSIMKTWLESLKSHPAQGGTFASISGRGYLTLNLKKGFV